MKHFLYLLPVAFLLVTSCSNRQKISSPDGKVSVQFRVAQHGIPVYCVKQDCKTVIDWSAMGVRTSEQDFNIGLRLLGVEKSGSTRTGMECMERGWRQPGKSCHRTAVHAHHGRTCRFHAGRLCFRESRHAADARSFYAHEPTGLVRMLL